MMQRIRLPKLYYWLESRAKLATTAKNNGLESELLVIRSQAVKSERGLLMLFGNCRQ
jgi:hypothetical protein